MNYLIDIVLAVIALITVFRCFKDGFAVSVLRFARVFIALIGALIIGNIFAGILSYIIGFIVVFIGVTVLMKILKFVTKIPLIHGFDKFLGLVLGIACAFLFLVVSSAFLRGILVLFDNITNGTGGVSVYLNSTLFRFMGEISVKLRLFR
jgi:hypothetical protein